MAGNLSYGDQRKLEVALSMAGQPRLLLLDEPMAGLSAAESRAMHTLIEQLDPGIAVLLIEHDMDVAFSFAERVTVLHQGRVLTAGHRDEVSANRTVQELRATGLVHWSGARARILNFDGLAKLADFDPTYLNLIKEPR